MKQYQELEDGGAYQLGNMTIPAAEGNRHYRQMLAEVAGEVEVEGEVVLAEVLPYVPPIPQVQPPTAMELLEARVTALELAL